jgi:hypothetical protein
MLEYLSLLIPYKMEVQQSVHENEENCICTVNVMKCLSINTHNTHSSIQDPKHKHSKL